MEAHAPSDGTGSGTPARYCSAQRERDHFVLTLMRLLEANNIWPGVAGWRQDGQHLALGDAMMRTRQPPQTEHRAWHHVSRHRGRRYGDAAIHWIQYAVYQFLNSAIFVHALISSVAICLAISSANADHARSVYECISSCKHHRHARFQVTSALGCSSGSFAKRIDGGALSSSAGDRDPDLANRN